MKRNPFVMCLTNVVAADITANGLLALGARPAMISEASEARQLAALADAVLVNVGTLNPEQAATMLAAVEACTEHHVPWVLDPVGCPLLEYRGKFVARLLASANLAAPAVIRGNNAEIDYLRAEFPRLDMPILSTGALDFIYHHGVQVATRAGGTDMMTRVTGVGCLQGAVCAALLGRGMEPLAAVEEASRLFKENGAAVAKITHAPGTFRALFIDALANDNEN